MAFMEWDESFSIGIAIIDRQHKEIIGLIDRLYGCLKVGDSDARIEGLLKELIELSEVHFKTEEDLFAKFKYSLILEHSVEHMRFKMIAMKFHQDFIDKKIGAPLQILDFLTVWLKDHILGKDRAYAAYLSEKIKGEAS
jgi:hemerythrin-like metal-binding protein